MRRSSGFRVGCSVSSLACVLLAAVATTLIPCCISGSRGGARVPTPNRVRAIWVTRWDYKTPRDIAYVMETCKRSGFNTVFFQVRGNGTVFYPSRFEVWADELGGSDPGFDPLKIACDEAHKRGLSLHAWANVVPGWRGKKPPANPRQLYNARPNWFWHDENGRREPLGWYNNLNVCLPEVRTHITRVMHEIVSRYPVDGLHLDYIRFPNEWNNAYPDGAKVPDYPRDAKTLALFRRATGRHPDEAPELWNDWRTSQVTALVRDIHSAAKRADRRVMVSAAVKADPDIGRRLHFQDARAWAREGIIDALVPMNYASEPAEFARRASIWAGETRHVPVIMGVMFDQRDAGTVLGQIRQSKMTGGNFAAFAYNSLFERLDGAGRPRSDGQSASRVSLRRDVLPNLVRR